MQLRERIRNMDIIDVRRLPNKEFSLFCEFKVAFELQKRGWEVYQPLIDRYIDLIAAKNGEYRTIQVKSSRIENIPTLNTQEYESYGLTMKPKDLFHDARHFFVWVFVDRNMEFHYFILDVKDFIDVRYYKLPKSSRRKYDSLLMRGEWRWGTDRLHPRHFFKGENAGKWEVEGAELNEYENKWDKLETIKASSYYIECIKATEIDEKWRNFDAEILRKWRENNERAERMLKQYPETYESSLKLLKEAVEEVSEEGEEGILDAHLLRLNEEEANKIFKETAERWEIFLPLGRTDHILLFRPVCSKCGRYWNTALKECFYCKTKYFRVKICERCNKPFPENVKPKQKCDCGGKIVKKCINCGEVEKDRKRVFVPITFCWYCGNRENKFEFKRVKMRDE